MASSVPNESSNVLYTCKSSECSFDIVVPEQSAVDGNKQYWFVENVIVANVILEELTVLLNDRSEQTYGTDRKVCIMQLKNYKEL